MSASWISWVGATTPPGLLMRTTTARTDGVVPVLLELAHDSVAVDDDALELHHRHPGRRPGAASRPRAHAEHQPRTNSRRHPEEDEDRCRQAA